jgi:hypothetical protein
MRSVYFLMLLSLSSFSFSKSTDSKKFKEVYSQIIHECSFATHPGECVDKEVAIYNEEQNELQASNSRKDKNEENEENQQGDE